MEVVYLIFLGLLISICNGQKSTASKDFIKYLDSSIEDDETSGAKTYQFQNSGRQPFIPPNAGRFPSGGNGLDGPNIASFGERQFPGAFPDGNSGGLPNQFGNSGLFFDVTKGQDSQLRNNDETGGPTNFQLPSRRVFPNQANINQNSPALRARLGTFSDYDDGLYRRPYYPSNQMNNGFREPNFDYEDYISVNGFTPAGQSNYPFSGFGNQGFPNNGFNQGIPGSMWNQGTASPMWNQWSSNTNPNMGFSNQGFSSPYSGQGFSSPYYNQGFSSPYSGQGFSSPYYNQGTSSPYYNQGTSSPYYNQGFSSSYPYQGFSNNYPSSFSNQGLINQRYPGQGFSGVFSSTPQTSFGNFAPAGFGNFAPPPYFQGGLQYPSNYNGRSGSLNDYDDFDNSLTPLSNPSRLMRSQNENIIPGRFSATSRSFDNEDNLNKRTRSSRAFDGKNNNKNVRSEKEVIPKSENPVKNV